MDETANTDWYIGETAVTVEVNITAETNVIAEAIRHLWQPKVNLYMNENTYSQG